MFEAEGPLTGIRATVDQDTVIVERQWGDDLATMVANEQSPIFYTVSSNPATSPCSPESTSATTPVHGPTRTASGNVRATGTARRHGTYQVIDAVTGETVGTLEDVPLNDRGIRAIQTSGRCP